LAFFTLKMTAALTLLRASFSKMFEISGEALHIIAPSQIIRKDTVIQRGRGSKQVDAKLMFVYKTIWADGGSATLQARRVRKACRWPRFAAIAAMALGSIRSFLALLRQAPESATRRRRNG
jgi:hypothetical protein